MSTFLRFLALVVVAGIVVDFAADFLDERFPGMSAWVVRVAGASVVAVVLGMLGWALATWLTAGRYAVEALIFNDADELLLYWHPHHKCMLPPGGRIGRSEFPNAALQERLDQRLGLEPGQYTFDERFHHGLEANSGNLGEIQRFAAPFLVQSEHHVQRGRVKFHYDLIYVLRLIDPAPDFSNSKHLPVHFVDAAALEAMVAQRRTFPDVLDAYTRALAIIARSAA